MHLARQHALTSHPPAPAFLHAAFYTASSSSSTATAAPDLFACATSTGFFVAHTSPLLELTRRQFSSSQGGLAFVLPVEHTSLLLLVGGGRVPRFAPNKLILWDDAATIATPAPDDARARAREGAAVAELEFAEGVTGVQIHPFDTPLPDQHVQSGAQTADAQQRTSTKFYIVVVVLKTKALVFELGPNGKLSQQHESAYSVLGQGKDTPSSGHQSNAWNIVHRTTVEIAGGARQGLAAIAPALLPPPSASTHHKRPRRELVAALIALPGRQKGHVQLVRVPILYGSTGSSDKNARRATGQQQPPADQSQVKPIGPSTIIIAHSSELNSITLSPCGRLLITSSDRGTLVRLWSVSGDPVPFGTHKKQGLEQISSSTPPTKSTGGSSLQPTLIRELRRGSDQAYILSVAIAPDLSALAVASDKGTIHIFRLTSEATKAKEASRTSEKTPVDRDSSSKSSSSFPIPKAFKKATSLTRKHLLPTATSSLSMLPTLPGSKQLKKYLGSEWSTSHFRIPLRTFGGRSAEGTWGERGGPGGMESPHVKVVMKKANPAAGDKGKQRESSDFETQTQAQGVTDVDRWASMGPTVERLGSVGDGFSDDLLDGGGGGSGGGGGAWVMDGIEDDEEEDGPIPAQFIPESQTGIPSPSSESEGPSSFKYVEPQSHRPVNTDSIRRGPIEAITGGSARSTEGGWAAMRARFDDIRHGEAGLDEKIFLTWTRARTQPSQPSSEAAATTTTTTSSRSYELIALTTGGGWYRIGLSTNPSERMKDTNTTNTPESGTHTPRASSDTRRVRGEEDSTARTTTTPPVSIMDDDDDDGGGGGGGESARRRAEEDRELEKSGMIQGCVLLEYRRFGQRDEWEGDAGAEAGTGTGGDGTVYS
ncbi:hypothetical protein A4X13_0g56 [Tilletia indica]|uniref:Uncharacterized protein n=1 Tax=Tilletia indica TaxID=43049 RepID=A0A177TYS5_9BASI|nr:hypothetical protein A4X13_0g56 [Tilletia indica]